MGEDSELWINSIYGSKAREPFVEFHYQDTVIQFSPEKAREVAMMLLESAEAAEQDGFLIEWAEKECGATEEGAVKILAFYREWREKRRGDAGKL